VTNAGLRDCLLLHSSLISSIIHSMMSEDIDFSSSIYFVMRCSGSLAGLPIKRLGVQIIAWAEICVEISAPSMSLANSAMMCSLYRGTMGPPAYAEAKKIKSPTLHTHVCLRS